MEQSEQVVLEGSGGRFPTISADFAAEGIAGDSIGLWYLDISDSDLQANCTAALTLYINSANPSVPGCAYHRSTRVTLSLSSS